MNGGGGPGSVALAHHPSSSSQHTPGAIELRRGGGPPNGALIADRDPRDVREVVRVDRERGPPMPESLARLAKANEDTWMTIGESILCGPIMIDV